MCWNETTFDLDRILRIDEVALLVGLSPATIWREIKAKRFPAPVKISARRVGWRTSDIRAWLVSRQVTSPP